MEKELIRKPSAAAQRNNGVDILKFLCALLVICIHVSFSEQLLVFTRVAVPIFFIISGYFVRNHRKQIKRILWLILIANAVYLVWLLITSAYLGVLSQTLWLVIASGCLV